jgi:hypothetical protein
MKICENCKEKKHCAELPGICLKLPCVLAVSVVALVVFLIINSTL